MAEAVSQASVRLPTQHEPTHHFTLEAMGLTVANKQILSQGEFIRLTRGLTEGSGNSGVLQAWWAGEPVPPVTVHAALNVGARMMARDDETEALVDLAVARIERAVPELRLD